MKQNRFLSFLILFLATARLGADDLNLIEINVLPQSLVNNHKYTVGEIAEIDGYDLKIVEAVSNLEIGVSPLPGTKYRISERSVYGTVSRKFPGYRVQVNVPDNSYIMKTGTEITEDTVRDIINEADKGFRGNNGEFKILSKVPKVILPDGDITHQVNRIGSKNSAGLSNWKISFFHNGKKVRGIYVRTMYETSGESLEQQVAEAAPEISPIKTDAVPEAAKRRLKPQPPNSGITKTGTVSSPVKYYNQRASNQYRSPKYDIVRGKRVILRYESDSIELKTIAKSMQSGVIGDIIQVRNISSNKIIEAEIVAKNQVKVVL